jgi:DNA-binding response OmpR family regulator
MQNGEKARVVLVAADEDLLNYLRVALDDTDLALLYASTKQEAISVIERLKSTIEIAIIELELSNLEGWDLIRRILFLPEKPLKIIATTSTFSEGFYGKIKAIGVDAVVPRDIPPEVWRKTVKALLVKNKNTL